MVPELVEALRHEIAELENGLDGHDQRCAQAAGTLVSRTSLIGLVERIYEAYATLRDTRLAIAEVGKLISLDDTLTQLAECDWPSRGYRYGGYLNDEGWIATLTGEVVKLLADADAPLPADGNGGSNSSSNPSSDRGGVPRGSPLRPRAQGARQTPSRRPARQRDPATGTWRVKEKTDDRSP